MTWFWKAKKERRKLRAEIEAAQDELTRVENREERVEELHKKLTAEMAGNHMGERLRIHFEQSRRRSRHEPT